MKTNNYKEFDFFDFKTRMTDVTALLSLAGHKEASQAMVALTHIITHRVGPENPVTEYAQRTRNDYSDMCDHLLAYINNELRVEVYEPPSPTDSATK